MRLDYDVYARGEDKYQSVQHRYYHAENRLRHMAEYFKERSSSKSVDRWGQSSRHLAFVADMDAHFLFVPKAWLRQILLIKLAGVQANLLYDRHFHECLTSDKYQLSQQLLGKVRLLNSRSQNQMLQHVQNMTTAPLSPFWKQLRVIHNIN